MESKIATYTESGVRLQLVRVRVELTSQWIIELRFNRKVCYRWVDEDALNARLFFCHCVSRVCSDREVAFLLHMTL